MNLNELGKYIRNWLVSSSNIDDSQVIFDFQNAPKPEQTFITLNPSRNITNYGQGEIIDNYDGTITITQCKQIEMSINCYGSDALEIMTNVQDSLDDIIVQQDFDKNNISVTPDSPLRNLTYIEGNEWQDRRQLDILVIFTKVTVQNIDYFDTIGITSYKLFPEYEKLPSQPVVSIEVIFDRDENHTLKISESTITHEIIEKDIEATIKATIERNLNDKILINKTVDVDIDIQSRKSTNLTSEKPNFHIFTHDFINGIYDISGNNNNWTETFLNILPEIIFEHTFTNSLDDSTGNNNNWIENNTPIPEQRIFRHDFSTLNDLANNNDWIEIN